MINSLPVGGHHNETRTLIEWVKDFPVRSCKIVVMHKDGEVGNHFHKNKDEIFYLLSGHGTATLEDKTEEFKEGDVVYVPAGTRHTFALSAGAILLGASTKPYDQNDEHR